MRTTHCHWSPRRFWQLPTALRRRSGLALGFVFYSFFMYKDDLILMLFVLP